MQKTPLKNLALILASLILVLLLSLITDRVLGLMMRPPHLPEKMELIFPPFSEQHYATSEFEYSVYTNALGLRDRELPRERGDTYRIVAIGDSYTYGWGVDMENTWIRILEADLREEGYDLEIINLGKPGVGTNFYVDIAEKAIPVLRPDLVIVGMLQGNDMRSVGPDDALISSGNFWDVIRAIYPNITRYARDVQREQGMDRRTQQDMPPQKTTAEENRQWTVNTALDFLENMPEEERARFDALEEGVQQAFVEGDLNPYLVDLALKNPDFYTLTIDPEDSWTQTCIQVVAGHFARIQEVAQEYNSKMIVVSIPEGPYVNKHALHNMARIGYDMPEWLLATDGPDNTIRQACEQAGAPFYEVTESFRVHQDTPTLYFELDGHPTPEGNRLFAESFRPILEQILNN